LRAGTGKPKPSFGVEIPAAAARQYAGTPDLIYEQPGEYRITRWSLPSAVCAQPGGGP
jgi:hypothetical protein